MSSSHEHNRLMEVETALMHLQRDFEELNSVVLAQRAELDRQRTVIAELQRILQRAMHEDEETTKTSTTVTTTTTTPPWL